MYNTLSIVIFHAVAGILGFSLVYGGSTSVNWAAPEPGNFPPYSGALPIVLSWFVSPVLAGGTAAFLFWIIRTLVLRTPNAYQRSLWALPVCVLVATWINIFFVLSKVSKRLM